MQYYPELTSTRRVYDGVTKRTAYIELSSAKKEKRRPHYAHRLFQEYVPTAQNAYGCYHFAKIKWTTVAPLDRRATSEKLHNEVHVQNPARVLPGRLPTSLSSGALALRRASWVENA